MDQLYGTILGLHDQLVPGQQDLSVAVSSPLPFPLTRCRIQANEHTVVEAIQIALAHHGLGELELEPGGFVDDRDFQLTILLPDIVEFAPDAVSCRNEDLVLVQGERLRDACLLYTSDAADE